MSTTTAPRTQVALESLDVSAFTIPTDEPESDGTLEWDSTTMVLVEAHAGDCTGLGYTYGDVSVGKFVESNLVDVVRGRDAMSVPGSWAAMRHEIRNAGAQGVGSMAMAAVDTALWDLKARLLDLPLASALGAFHDEVPVYGSGGFTSYSDERLARQLGGWAAQGIPRVKMKVGRDPQRDPKRARVAREAVGDDVELMVDANGAYTRKQALYWAQRFAHDFAVTYLEEPVSSDDLEGLRLLRDRAPANVAIAAGEYGWDIFYYQRMLEAEAVDIVQADVTRCAGITELLRISALAKARCLPFSGHCAPALHAHAACAIEPLIHLEYFHDHVRIEGMLFEGTLEPVDGALRPDLGRPGNGLELRRSEAERWAV